MRYILTEAKTLSHYHPAFTIQQVVATHINLSSKCAVQFKVFCFPFHFQRTLVHIAHFLVMSPVLKVEAVVHAENYSGRQVQMHS